MLCIPVYSDSDEIFPLTKTGFDTTIPDRKDMSSHLALVRQITVHAVYPNLDIEAV